MSLIRDPFCIVERLCDIFGSRAITHSSCHDVLKGGSFVALQSLRTYQNMESSSNVWTLYTLTIDFTIKITKIYVIKWSLQKMCIKLKKIPHSSLVPKSVCSSRDRTAGSVLHFDKIFFAYDHSTYNCFPLFIFLWSEIRDAAKCEGVLIFNC